MNVLVTGSQGQLGKCIADEKKNPSDSYFYTDINDLDICNQEALKDYVCKNNIDVIVNCAAYTNVDKAEESDQYDLVEQINAVAPGNMAKLCKENGILLIHISTDYVFGGNLNNIPCTENQLPNPSGVYGKSKLRAEEMIEKSGCNYIILRTAWLYSEYGHNFVKTMLNLFDHHERLNVIFDQVGTPTYAHDLSSAVIDIINHRKFKGTTGIYHFSNEGVCSWYDFAKMIQVFSSKNRCDIFPCHSDEFPSKVKRPSYSVLDKTKYKKTFKMQIPYWFDSLKTCVHNLVPK